MTTLALITFVIYATFRTVSVDIFAQYIFSWQQTSHNTLPRHIIPNVRHFLAGDSVTANEVRNGLAHLPL